MRIAIGAVGIVPNAPDSLTGDMLPCRFVSGTRRCGAPLYSRLMESFSTRHARIAAP
jgi:hypothetical protein